MDFKQKLIVLMAILPVTFSAAYTKKNREYGFFDLSVGPVLVDDVKFSNTVTKYSIGPCISTSLGMNNSNGLGVGVNFIYTYNSIQQDLPASGAPANVNLNQSPDTSASIVKLGFMYKASASKEISFLVNAGPCAVITNDLTLKVSEVDATENTAASGAASVQATVNDATTGQQTVAVNVETGSASGDNTSDSTTQAESVSNFTFGYNISAGLEYRQDRHKAFGLEFGYINSKLFQSTFVSGNDQTQVSTQQSGDLDSSYVSLLIRYYI